jgi:hypothetical protein
MRKKKKVLPKWMAIPIVIIPFAVLFYFLYSSHQEEVIDIEENKKSTIGSITRTYRIKSRGDFIVYDFNFDQKTYDRHQSVEGDYNVGDCYLVQFSSKNPKHSKMLLSEKKVCK